MRRVLTYSIALSLASVAPRSGQNTSATAAADLVRGLTRDTTWTLVETVPMKFTAHHPQGMVKIGDTFFVSSVEIKVRTKRYPKPVDGYDRDVGEGVGHLFKIDRAGNLVADLVLGEGPMYHPGGIDYDGHYIWVPVSEYRPNSRSIIYRVDPGTMKAEEVFRYGDSIGGIVHDTDDRSLHGNSWGSRRFYRWTLDANGRVTNATVPPETLRTLNTSHYVDYQDCKYAGSHRMLCTGVTEIRQRPDAPAFRLGGIDLIDLRDGRPLHQVPLLLWTAGGLVMTHNPVWLEAFDSAQGRPTETGLRGYFMPEDDKSTLYVYEVAR